MKDGGASLAKPVDQVATPAKAKKAAAKPADQVATR
jgi:hypothetical protein